MSNVAEYAWVITEDNLYNPAFTTDPEPNEAGTMGPRNADEYLIEVLSGITTLHAALGTNPNESAFGGTNPVHLYKFRMYDDDDILYYTGYLATYANNPDMPDEEALMAPLYNFGGPNAGAVLIRYENHPEWDIEY